MSVETEWGVTSGYHPGFYGKDLPKVLSYSPAKMPNACLALCVVRQLTVCGTCYRLLHHLLFLGYSLALMFLLSHDYAFPDGRPACNNGGGEKSTVNKAMCHLEQNLVEAKVEFRFLVAFILAGFVGFTVTMWRTRRTNYASLCGNVRNLTVQIQSLLPLRPEFFAVRRRLARWTLLVFEIAMLKARGEMDSDEGREFLENYRYGKGYLLEPGEWDALVGGDRHTTVVWWIQTHLKQLHEEGVLTDFQVLHIAQSITSLRGQANDLMSSLDRDNPFPYVQLCGLLVYINIFIMCTWKGVEWSIWTYGGKEWGQIWMVQPKIWVDTLVLLSWNISYAALYDLAYMLDNPFKGRWVDVGHETIGNGLRILGEELSEANSHLPPSMTTGFGHRDTNPLPQTFSPRNPQDQLQHPLDPPPWQQGPTHR
eukprot:Hpha_TRINITY_DN7365_c0_g1::TRINITY_DN7365_c0_g1_i1::g.9889::m.9889